MHKLSFEKLGLERGCEVKLLLLDLESHELYQKKMKYECRIAGGVVFTDAKDIKVVTWVELVEVSIIEQPRTKDEIIEYNESFKGRETGVKIAIKL